MYEFVIKQFLLKYIPVLFNLGRDLWFVHEAPDGMVPIPCAHCSICMYNVHIWSTWCQWRGTDRRNTSWFRQTPAGARHTATETQVGLIIKNFRTLKWTESSQSTYSSYIVTIHPQENTYLISICQLVIVQESRTTWVHRVEMSYI